MAEKSFTAVVIGASGLTGTALVKKLTESDHCVQVHVIVRKPMTTLPSKVHQHIVDFDDRSQLEACIPPDAVLFSCMGTTMKKVKGDKAAYRKIDHDIPLRVASIVMEKGGREMVLLSSIGAKEESGNFYLSLKGAIESSFISLQPDTLHIYRPSVLVGHRIENRLGERFGQVLLKLLSFLLLGNWSNYRPAPVEKIAASMVQVAGQKRPGVHYYYWKDFI